VKAIFCEVEELASGWGRILEIARISGSADRTTDSGQHLGAVPQCSRAPPNRMQPLGGPANGQVVPIPAIGLDA